MANKNINQDRDNGIWGELLTQKDKEKDLEEVLKLEKPEIDTSGNPPAKSFWSTGRGCPNCKRTLKMKELNQDTGELWVFCDNCGAQFSSQDIENTSEIGDSLHRRIPDDLVLRWMQAREEELNRNK